MPLARTQETYTEIQYIPAMDANDTSLSGFPSNYSVGMNALRDPVPFETSGKLKLDPTCVLEFGVLNFSDFNVPCFESLVSAGYPFDADDSVDRGFDLMDHLIRHPKTVYYVRAKGYSLVEAGIFHKDILVVDTAVEPQHGSIVIAVVNGELTIKRLHNEGPELMLLSANPDYPPVTITRDMSFFIQGVVTSVIRHFKPHHWN